MDNGKRVYVIDNPLAKYFLTILRDKNTMPPKFREIMRKLGFILAYEISRELKWKEVTVETPLSKARGLEPYTNIWIIAILGAGVPLALGMHEAFPWAGLGFIAARRFEEDKDIRVEVYYERMPESLRGTIAIIADPMLATGNTMVKVLEIVRRRECEKAIIASVVASKYGIKKLLNSFNDVNIYVLAIDPELNDKAFIVPGLGDAGDRALSSI
ncbi:MAG: uracil phosphoribosyltransferase [Thermoprotei archaeon]|nr:MAG: uracil phosphoribosyltransferase [Thermoprotei archaeon]